MTKLFFKYAITILRLGFFALAIYQIWNQDWVGLFVVAQAILVSFLPNLLWRFYKIFTPISLRVGIVFFMCFTLILGEMADFYSMFWWWDLALHFFSSVGITLISFISIFVLFKETDLKTTPIFTSTLAVSLSLAVAVLWEIYEFMVDYFFVLARPAQPSNQDTVTDLMVALVGSVLVVMFCFGFLKGRKVNRISQIIADGVKHN